MTLNNTSLSASPETVILPKHRVNWHEAAACAVQIELRDYEHMLDFQTEYMLGHNSYRIELLVIRKLSDLLSAPADNCQHQNERSTPYGM